ncbi:hypothetical protein [Shewanella chilikensis]|jgi:hypothetical protein|uniref:hypothetical protein n=1 Tax=Shewanella chilikensis TaxID=558541 RepID=UPI001CD652E1|nr:hypothetical protein [Shewanella chilikensis]MCA0951100.1 hypothetical protein [Shewanella chilikensis]
MDDNQDRTSWNHFREVQAKETARREAVSRMDTQKIFPVIRKLPRQERPFETGRSAKESVQDEVEDRLRDASLWVKGKPNSWTTTSSWMGKHGR